MPHKTPLGTVATSVSNSSVGISIPAITRSGSSDAFLPAANNALLKAETTNIRWRDDGTAPTSATGMLMLTTDVPYDYDGNITALRFFSTSGASATVATVTANLYRKDVN